MKRLENFKLHTLYGTVWDIEVKNNKIGLINEVCSVIEYQDITSFCNIVRAIPNQDETLIKFLSENYPEYML